MLLRNTGGRLDIAVGRNNLGKFYHDVLPKLREIADVREEHPERMRGLIPPKPTFTAYLDYYKEALLYSAEVSYGKKTYPVTDVIDAAVGKTRLSPYYRDEEAERAYCNVLNRYFDLYDPSMKLMYTDKDDDKLFELLDHGTPGLRRSPDDSTVPESQNPAQDADEGRYQCEQQPVGSYGYF